VGIVPGFVFLLLSGAICCYSHHLINFSVVKYNFSSFSDLLTNRVSPLVARFDNTLRFCFFIGIIVTYKLVCASLAT
jgi:hypothetical protein